MEVLLLLVMGVMNIACFMIGVNVRQKVDKGEEVRLPSPMDAVRAQQERKEAEIEKSRMDAILRNIDNYDGTASGQEDVP
jgi:hypothetical protein